MTFLITYVVLPDLTQAVFNVTTYIILHHPVQQESISQVS